MNATMFVLVLYLGAYPANHTATTITGFHTIEACQSAAAQFTKQNWPRAASAVCYALPTGAKEPPK